MSENEKNVPKRRFKEFENAEAWQQCKLGDVTNYIKGYAFKSMDYIEEGVRIIRVSDLTKDRISEMVEKTFIDKDRAKLYSNYTIKHGDIVITTVGSKAELKESAVGRPILINENRQYLLNQNLVKISPIQNYSSQFIYNHLLQVEYSKYIESIQRGNANQANITINDLWEYLLQCPTIEEQDEIGRLFENLDRLITLHQRKLEKMKALKKAYLTEMFPAEGERKPKLRFAGFTDDWEQRKVEDIGNIVTGSTPSTSDSTNYGGEYLFVSPVDIQGNRYIKNTITKLSKNGFKKCRILKEGSTLFVSIGSTIGKVAQIKEMATTNQQINSIEPSEKYNNDFIYSVMEHKAKEIKDLAATQAVPIVNKTTFSKVNVIIPTVITEQIKIGEFFKQLDNLITLHQHKLEKLQNIKKAYLNEMFI